MAHMKTTHRALQAALAAEIGAKLGYAHKTQTWLQDQAGFSPKSWQRWFLHCDRDLPVSTLIDIAAAIDVPASELLAAAQEKAPLFEPRFLGLDSEVQAALEEAIAEKMPQEPPSLRSVDDEDDERHQGSA